MYSILLRGRVAAQKHRNRRVASRSFDRYAKQKDGRGWSNCLPVTLCTQMRYSGQQIIPFSF